jgi:hypothetical protein
MLIKRFVFLSPENGDGGGGGGGSSSGSGSGQDGGGGDGTNKPVETGGLTLGDGTVWRNAKELKDALQRARETEKTLAKLAPLAEQVEKLQAALGGGVQQQATQQQQAAAPVTQTAPDMAAIEARMSFREALVDFEIPKEKRGIVEKLWNAEKTRPADVGAWMTATIDELGFKAAAPVVKPPIAPSNGGAPVRDPGGSQKLPESPFEWPRDVVEKMPFAEFHAEVQKYLSRHKGNPFHEFHARRNGGEKKG